MPDEASVKIIYKLNDDITKLGEINIDLEREVSDLEDEIEDLKTIRISLEKELADLQDSKETEFVCDLIKDTCADADVYLGYTGSENEIQHATALLTLLGEKAKRAPS